MKVRLKPLDQQVMVIVGASSGIGLATARAAASRGARLVLVGRSENALRRLAAELSNSSRRAIAVTADVSVAEDVRRVADETERVFGGFDTWVNNAAVSAYGACLDVSVEDMRRIMETNFWGMVYGSRIACAHLARRGGALINVGSIVSDRAAPLQGIYSASKHAIKGWTDALRTELTYAGAPISVTLIKPAAINSPYAEHAKNYLRDQPSHVPPVYSPRSVAEAILYAASHPVREMVVGSSGKILSLANFMAPGLTESLMARLLLPATHSGRPRQGRPILYEASEDLRESGDYQGVVRKSAYTTIATHPTIATAVGAAGAAMMLASLWRSRSRRTVTVLEEPAPQLAT